MFRVKPSRANRVLVSAMILLLVAIAGAMVATLWSVIEVRKERRVIEELLVGETSEAVQDAMALAGELDWHHLSLWLVLIVLAAAGVALTLTLLAYLSSQRSLRELKSLAFDILASMDQAVVTTDCKHVVTSVNPRAGELLGLDFDAVGRPLAEVCGDTRLEQLSYVTLRTRQSSPERDFAVSQTGSRQRLRAKCYLLKDTTGACPGTLLIVRDVTERVLMEERLRRMERFMGLGTLAAGLHHEIKNPLGAVSLHIQLLEEKLEDSADERSVEHLSVVKTEAARISEVLEIFRDFALVERLDQQPTDLGPLLEQAERLIAPQADRQNVHVRVELQEGPTISAEVDAVRTGQVLLNLLLNSLDEMPDGGDLTLRLLADRQNAYIEVEDTGAGIPEDVQSRVFDPYFTTKSRGSGMGLAISQKIMQQHAGDIDFESGPEGTVFRLTIPRTNPDHERS